MLKLSLIILILFTSCNLFAGGAEHPRIYYSVAKKIDIIHSINSVEWKKQLVAEKKTTLEKYLNYCMEDPQ